MNKIEKCPLCGEILNKNSILKKHIEIIHPQNPNVFQKLYIN